jgi:Ca2+-binding EF-hand superfamily protein
MALAKAEAIINGNPRAEEVNLDGLGLDDLSPLLEPLSQLTRLRKLKIAKNRLAALPEDLSAIRTVETLDMAGNPVSGLNAVIRGLFTLPNLRHLHIDLPFETDEDEIIVSLHSLESFNGTPLTDTFDNDDGPAQPQSAAPAASQNKGAAGASPKQAWAAPNSARGRSEGQAAIAAKTRWEDADTTQVQRLYEAANSVSNRVVNRSEFDEYTRNVVSHLQTLLTGEDDPFRRNAEILKAKKIMFEYCFEEIARSSHRFDPNLSQVLGVLQDTYGGLLDSHEHLFKGVVDDRERKLELMKADMQQAIQEIESLMQQMDGQGGQGGGGKQWEGEKRKMSEEIGWLRTENEKLQGRLKQAEMARGTPSRATAGASLQQSLGSAASPNRTRTTGGAPTTGKVLTLRQLRDVTEDIYASKSKYDIKCAETHLPRETMEQHMYTYLNQRYGLKHLILEWATAIIQGVKKYTADDNDVAVFGKILRNEIDEEFRFVQRQLKETVHELLRVYLKGKYPLKGDEEISQMLRKRINATVSHDEWVDIVKYMYNTEDSVSIIMRVEDVLKQRQAPQRRREARRGSATTGRDGKGAQEDKSIAYSDFLRILLDFQLEGHERFLARFVRIFKQHDTDRNGVVNEHEFRLVLKAVDPSKTEDEINALLDLIDPHNNQLINFSECVTFLSSELVRMMRDEGH